MIKNKIYLIAFLLAAATSLTSCQAIADIFKAGVWVGVLMVVVVVALIIWLISKFSKK